jgi:hypothetical protein
MSGRSIPFRLLAATLVLAARTVLWAVLAGAAARESPARALIAYVPLLVVCGVGTAALIRGWWWGRMLAMALSLYSVLDAIDELVVAPSEWQPVVGALAGLAVVGALAGSSMFERFEGRAPLPLSWGKPRMAVVRWAIIASACTLLAAVMNVEDAAEGLGLLGGQPVLRPEAIAPFVLGCLFTAILAGGLVLLALQRTAGLPVVAVSVLVLSATMLRELLWGSMGLRLAIVLAPGLVMAWVATIVWSGPIIGFLRGGVTR